MNRSLHSTSSDVRVAKFTCSGGRSRALAAILLTLLAITSAFAGDFDLTWHTIDGGGGTSTGGGFTLSGTVGQPDAGAMSGGQYALAGGFWAGAGDIEPKTPTCPADINGDGVVDVSDLLALLGEWGTCPDPLNCPADLNSDGVVDVSDLLVLLGAWGPCPDN